MSGEPEFYTGGAKLVGGGGTWLGDKDKVRPAEVDCGGRGGRF